MKAFLTANWTNLINATYALNPDLLLPHLPDGVELDIVGGKAFVSVVPFDFTETTFLGMKIPFHINFTEINLRFYVHRGEKRGVVFLTEYISKFFIKEIANRMYYENYALGKLASCIAETEKEISVTHTLEKNGRKFFIEVAGENKPCLPVHNSTEHFFEERFYGYSKTPIGKALEFRVEHPSWEIYPVKNFKTDFDFGFLFGEKWKCLNETKPHCVMLVKGSHVKMFPHRPLVTSSSAAYRESVRGQSVLDTSFGHSNYRTLLNHHLARANHSIFGRHIAESFRIQLIPTTFIIDQKAEIRFVQVGYVPGVEEGFKDIISSTLDE